MHIQIVVVVDENNGIGKNNQLLCHMPADLKHFKKLTLGHPVIMGRKTFESMGKALPGRRNMVITRGDLEFENAETTDSIQKAIELCGGESLISIIGGASIFKQSMHLVQTVQLTCIHQAFEADTFFPEIDSTVWKKEAEERHPADDKNPYPYTFITYQKR